LAATEIPSYISYEVFLSYIGMGLSDMSLGKLIEASQAGVKIKMLIRGICCLIPGVPGKTENITVTSIVGRFLEHSRIYCFGEGEDVRIYISSADIMTRNQERRVEVACPINSPEIKKALCDYLACALRDNLKARRMTPGGDYVRVQPDGNEPLSVQKYCMEHPLSLAPTQLAKPTIVQRIRTLGFFRRKGS